MKAFAPGPVLLLALCAAACAAGDELRGPYMPYEAFDRLPHQRIDVHGGVIEVAFGPGSELPHEPAMAWARRCAETVAKYYGRFPVRRLKLLIVPVKGDGVGFGQSFASQGAAIRVIVGTGVTAQQFDRDWVLVHEMIHQALPMLADQHHWLEEGLATYIEPAARAMAGNRTPEDVWREWAKNMPKGIPDADDRGLDRTHSWASTYWGGALFGLLADVEIRRQTGNRKGLRDALRGVLARGNMEQDWPVEQVFKVGDDATGTTVLTDLYRKAATQPYRPDLDTLWKELGVELAGDTVRFDDRAPLAAVRKAITAP